MLWAGQLSDFAHLQYHLQEHVPSFIKISQFLLKLSFAQTDERTDRHSKLNSSRHADMKSVIIIM